MGSLIQDLRYSLRTLRKTPVFTSVAVLALALGIGANSAIFSVVNAVLLRPLPFDHPERMMSVQVRNEKTGGVGVEQSYPNFLDLRAQCQSCEGMAAYGGATTFLMNPGEEPERVRGVQASADLLPLLGVKPALGRVFTAAEDQVGGRRVVVLSYGVWQRFFGGNPKIIGQDIPLGGSAPTTVLGVMPKGFKFPVEWQQTDFWMPLAPAISPEDREGRAMVWLDLLAKTKPGVSQQQAQAEIDTISRRLQAQYPATNTALNFFVKPLKENLVGNLRTALLVLLGAVGCVLLIACANVANLLLARAAGRSKEMSIRTALGASRSRIVRQLLTESLLLALVGGALGLLLALWGVDLLAAAAPADIPRVAEIGLDARVLLFTLLVTLATGVVFGLAPALQASKADVNEALKEGGRGTGEGGGRRRLRGALVVSEVALSLVLLIGAGLLAQSFKRLLDVTPGFDAKNLVTMDVVPRRSRYPEEPQRVQFFKDFAEQASRLPGVRGVGLVDPLPLNGNFEAWDFQIEGRAPFAPGEQNDADRRVVNGDYFRVMGIPLRRGRTFDDRDRKEAPQVLVVNDTFARQFFPGDDPLGKRIVFGGGPAGGTAREIVGVVGDVRHAGLDEPATPEFYVPYTQVLTARLTVVARSASDDTAGVAGALRGVIRRTDKDSPVYNVRTMEELLAASVAKRRFNMILLGGFAAVALVLAALGIYGVISYTVTQRTHEIGVRVALGAQPGDVVRMILSQGMRLTLLGVGVGLLGASALTRVMSGLLFGVSATDPVTFGGVALLLAGVAFVSCLLPARRATKVDPMIALRYE
ncbi:MAG TPA: ABC transporter permease [Pyrinomonadaceae bacterium]|nr:ABC transporter permease [Pyrinomonadaceae bacterium]